MKLSVSMRTAPAHSGPLCSASLLVTLLRPEFEWVNQRSGNRQHECHRGRRRTHVLQSIFRLGCCSSKATQWRQPAYFSFAESACQAVIS